MTQPTGDRCCYWRLGIAGVLHHTCPTRWMQPARIPAPTTPGSPR